MLTDEYELNRKIHSGEDATIPLYEDDKVNLYYVKKTESDKEHEYIVHQMDVLYVELKEKNVTISHRPHLDPFVSMEGNIVCMTSDGECWVCDVNTGKENSIYMSIVAFDHYIDLSDDEQRRDIPNTFVVSGTGCYWGCEAYEQGFEIYIDRDTLEEKEQDVWDEDEGYEEYRKSIDDEDDGEEGEVEE